MNEYEKLDKVDKFIAQVADTYHNDSLANFIYDMRYCFFNNITDSDYDLANGEVIKRGTKIVKAFKYFEADKDRCADLQNAASRIIQETKITGTLCLSVHPLDFLSSSENDHNWRSCHALDGEYRAGNLSYMVDEGTVMVYLRSDRNTKLPNFPSWVPWNSKKWRVLLFFSNDYEMLFLGRQYPFFADGGADFITKQLLPSFGLGHWTDWTDITVSHIKIGNINHLLDGKYLPVGGKLIKLTDLIEDGQDAMNFNDLLQSSCYTPMYCYRAPSHDIFYAYYGTERTHFKIGGPVNCLRCGKTHITYSDTMLCAACEVEYGHLNNDDFGYCVCCGEHFQLDTGILTLQGNVCPQCTQTEIKECDQCGELMLKDDLIFDKKVGRYICPMCHQMDIYRHIRKG